MEKSNIAKTEREQLIIDMFTNELDRKNKEIRKLKLYLKLNNFSTKYKINISKINYN